MKKILITYATAGIGHKKAACAIKKAYDEMGRRDTEVTVIDALDYTPDFFKWSYLQLYLLAVNKLSTLWGISYYLTDNKVLNVVIAQLRRVNNWLNSRRFERYLIDTKPDVIISTHFFASEVIADLKARALIGSSLITVVTDYRLHAWWVVKPTDTYVVGCEDTRQDLLGWGVDDKRIHVIGIPAEPVFSKPVVKNEARACLGLRQDIFTVLVIGGGFGVGPIEDIVKTVTSLKRELQVVVICGHNEDLCHKIEAIRNVSPVPVKVLGFVDNVHEYMAAADILISKSGGITVTESLARELPMIIISPIPGQETGNASVLTKNRAAIQLKSVAELSEALERCAADPLKIEAMKTVIRKIRKPNACFDIANMAITYTK